MPENLEAIGQDSLLFEAIEATTLTARDVAARAAGGRHPNPISHALPRTGMSLDVNRAALVVIDPQVEFTTSSAPHENAVQLRTIQNFVRLAEATKLTGIPLAISLTAPREFHSDVIPALKSYVEDDKTIICWPHVMLRQFWVNDIGLRLRQQQIAQVILAGMLVSLRIETHLRDFIEQGFEVAIVTDAVSGARLPEGIGYLSALINFRRIVNALWTTDETIRRLGWAVPTHFAAAPEGGEIL
jgi:nicotinamidase-related amidase